MSNFPPEQTISGIKHVVDALIASGLAEATPEEIEAHLSKRLQQELLVSLTEGKPFPEWAQGDYSTENLAVKFLNFQRAAIFNEICDPNKKMLKTKYSKLILDTSTNAAAVISLAVTLIGIFGITAPQVAIPAIAGYVALWLLRVNLEQWCREGCKE